MHASITGETVHDEQILMYKSLCWMRHGGRKDEATDIETV